MMASENLDLLAQQDWEGQMNNVLEKAAQQFNVLKKSISDHEKAVEKAKKVECNTKKVECNVKKVECNTKKVATVVERAARAHGHIQGNRGGERGGVQEEEAQPATPVLK